MRVIVSILFLISATMYCQIHAGGIDSSSLPPGDSPPPTVTDRIKNAGAADDFEDAAYLIVLDLTVNHVNELGISYQDNQLIYKVLTEEGCRKHAVLMWHYEPMSSYIEINEVNLIRDESIIPVDVNSILDLPAPQHGIYWADRIKVLQLPRLHVNDGIEIKSFKKGYSYALLDNETRNSPDDERYIPPMPGEYFEVVLFEATVPIIEKKYIIELAPGKKLHSQIYNGPMYSSTSYKGDTTIYSWWAKDIPAWDPEPSRPDATDIVTKVVMATVQDWESKSRWFFDVNESQFEYTDAIKAKVDEILENAGVLNGTDEEKAFELVHWVAQNIRYSGQTMGEGEGFTLHSGEMIFEQRSGVCKDIAGMLVTMMRAAGLDSYGAMTMAGSRIEEVPADQFNHCVVALRKDDGSFEMYDPTWVPYYKDIWSKSENEQHYLIGSPEGESLSQIPYSPPEESPLFLTNEGRILEDGTLEATLKLRCDGKMDGYMRGFLTWYPMSETGNEWAYMLKAISDRIEILDYRYGDVHDFHESMWWDIKYRVPEFAMFVGDGIEFKSPMMALTAGYNMLFKYTNREWPEERHDDLFFYSTELLDAKETIKLPDGYKIAKPTNSKEIDETYAYFKGESDMKGGQFVVKQKASVKRRQIPSKGYPGFRKAIMEINDYASHVFRVEKGGDK